MTEPEPLNVFVDLDDEKKVGEALRTLLRLLAAQRGEDEELFKAQMRETIGHDTPLSVAEATERFTYLLYAATLLAAGLRVAGEKAQQRLIDEHNLDAKALTRDDLTDIAENTVEELLRRNPRPALDE